MQNSPACPPAHRPARLCASWHHQNQVRGRPSWMGFAELSTSSSSSSQSEDLEPNTCDLPRTQWQGLRGPSQSETGGACICPRSQEMLKSSRQEHQSQDEESALLLTVRSPGPLVLSSLHSCCPISLSVCFALGEFFWSSSSPRVMEGTEVSFHLCLSNQTGTIPSKT